MDSKTTAISALLLLLCFLRSCHASPSFNISAVFAFGDSTFDAGNNDRLLTVFRADHAPYGQDFPSSKPTGRFSNGKLVTDFLVSALGFKDSLPAYLTGGLSELDLSTGVSFASAGSGLDDLTARTVNVATMDMQLGYFQEYLNGLNTSMGKEKADELINNALFVIGAGSSDMIMNFYMLPMRRISYSLPRYHGYLLQRLESFAQRLYNMGARKFVVTGLPPIGCIPLQMTLQPLQIVNFPSTIPNPRTMLQRSCIDQQNKDSEAYNSLLLSMLTRLQSSLSGTKFVYADIYDPLMDMIKNPKDYGFRQTMRGCCGTGLMEMGPLCTSLVPSCPEPASFMFWDSVHPSEATYQALAKLLMEIIIPQFAS